MSDFTATLDASGTFVKTELDSGVDFTETGDFGQIVVSGSVGFGEGGFGEGGFGGDTTTTVLGISTTIWRNIDTP